MTLGETLSTLRLIVGRAVFDVLYLGADSRTGVLSAGLEIVTADGDDPTLRPSFKYRGDLGRWVCTPDGGVSDQLDPFVYGPGLVLTLNGTLTYDITDYNTGLPVVLLESTVICSWGIQQRPGSGFDFTLTNPGAGRGSTIVFAHLGAETDPYIHQARKA